MNNNSYTKVGFLSFIVVVVSFLMILWVRNYQILLQTKADFPANKSANIFNPTVSKTQIAANVLSCLNNMRDSRGAYLYSRGMESNSSGPRPIWARFKSFEKTNDSLDLEIIRQDLIINTTRIPTIQNDSYNCKLMLDLYVSNIFSGQEKEQIKNICLAGVYDSIILIPEFNFASFLARQRVNGNSNGNISSSPNAKKMAKNAFQASDLTAKYSFTGLKTDLDKAKSFFASAANSYRYGTYTSNDNNSVCILGTAAVDLGYLDFAEYIWQSEQISPAKFYAGTAKTDCAFFANRLYQTTKEIQYREAREDFLNLLIGENLDKDGCFVSQVQSEAVIKDSGQNGITAGLLMEP